MKRILFNIRRLTNGGAERVVALWSGILAERGYEVSLYLSYRSEDEYYVDSSVNIASTAQLQKDFLALSHYKRMRKHRDYIKKFKPDVIINFLPKTQIEMMLISSGIKSRRIETVRNNPWIDADVGRSRPLWNMCFKRADAIIVQTPEQIDYFSLSERNKCTVVRNPLDKAYKALPDRSYEKEAIRFVASGRLSAQKNYPMMIEAFSKIAKKNDKISLDIYGKGSEGYTTYLQQCIDQADMAGRITLKGQSNNMSEVLKLYDSYIMSSDYEGMPNALAEAMATGMVCISTDCKTGPCDMIENGRNGYLVKTGDVDSMAETIEKVISMTGEQCKEMGSAAREGILALCDDEVNIKKLIDVIEG
ncbi:MAG: glycosyltransferase [Clostridia bacterium]|nr:glycosyltransferase [Clostridia bacterium]